MPTVPIYNIEGKQTGAFDLAPDVFAVPSNPSVLHQVVIATLANRRTAIASTKRRGEVRGGGRKPWAQKHTGRARHGSIRSPLWVGGGIVFGPRSDRSFLQKINVKVRRQAIRVALSEKVRSQRLLVLEDFPSARTRDMVPLLARLRGLVTVERRFPSFLVALPEARRDAARGVRNIPRVSGIDVAHLNAVDVLRNDILVMTLDGARQVNARLRPRARLARPARTASPASPA